MKGFFYWIIIMTMYFVPTMVACKRNHPKSVAITALNYLSGWTIIGWIGAIVWALADAGPELTGSEAAKKAAKHVFGCLAIVFATLFVVSFVFGLVRDL